MVQSLFYFLAFLSVLSALLVVFSRNAVHSILFLIITFFSIAGQYILMNAQFLGVVQVIVYAGAIMVLFLFVIMMLNLNRETEPQTSNLVKFAGAISGGMLLIVLVASLKGADQIVPANGMDVRTGLISNLGKVLLTDFKLPLEVASLLFLAAMVGAVMLGKKEIE
ncbi:MAG: NADH-quinone oxidoreductase subunit J [Chitinophagales bacterium]|nr:NADH-quinone oxidoreductase subunit J [Chitinophagales bacterium]